MRHPPLRTYDNDTTPNWSGAVVVPQRGDSIDRAVGGTWTVPSIKNVDGQVDYCSQWVGIDGAEALNPDLGNNLLQAGVTSYVDSSGNAVYYPWWEWLSQTDAVPEMKITNVSAAPGKFMDITIWVTSDNTANVSIFSGTEPEDQVAVLIPITAPGTVEIIGGSAEWIVERPAGEVSGILAPYPLADYRTVEFDTAMAWTASEATLLAGEGIFLSMTNDAGQAVSTAQSTFEPPDRSQSITCSYVGPT